MEKHFGHKVDVERRDGVVHVHIPAGRFELEPRGDVLAVTVNAPDAPSRARVEQVCADHLERFAHASLTIDWRHAD
jgi:hypothetical protein